MGDMADYYREQDEFWENDEREWKKEETMELYSNPFIWLRANGATIHIKDMNNHHLGNAIKHLEKSLEGYGDMPVIYFNMLKLASARGLGITQDQVNRLLDMATKPKPVVFAAYDPNMDYDSLSWDGTILKLEEDDDEVALVVCNGDGDQEYKLVSFLKDGCMHIYSEIPEDSKISHKGPQIELVVH